MSNKVTLCGIANDDLEFYYNAYNENYYKTDLAVMRDSGTFDIIPVVVSEKVFDVSQKVKDRKLMITGEMRSRNDVKDGKKKLLLFVYAFSVEFSDSDYENEIHINGYVVKDAVLRETPLKRLISDLLIASNRAFNKSDYIPCIAWGKNAILSDTISVGALVDIDGRIQSREYQKKMDDDSVETKTAYEVSVRFIGL